MHIFLHPDATNDLEKLAQGSAKEQEAWADLSVFLEELKTNRLYYSKLLEHDYGKYDFDASFGISKWLKEFNRGNNLWRCKLLGKDSTANDYRIIYAYIVGKNQYRILGIAHRKQIDYDNPNEFMDRVKKVYTNEIA
jgi:mRNA-degrading endonuclease RelE of RelBE toxin-antitoxin system